MHPTAKVFRDLTIWLVVLGLAAAALVPLLAVWLGVPSETARSAPFIVVWLVVWASLWASTVLVTRIVVGRAFAGPLAALDAAEHSQRAYQSFGEALAARGDLDTLAAEAIEHYVRHAGAVAGMVVYESDGELVIAASHGFSDPPSLARSAEVVGVARSGQRKELSTPDAVLVDGGAVDGGAARAQPHTMLIDPIVARGTQLGVIVLASAAAFDDAHRSRIDLFGRGLALALHAGLAHDRLQRLAAVDRLTGMLNRHFGLERLREEYARSVREASSLGVLMIDLDDFQAVNDAHGHTVGDRVLRTVALVARAALRDGDVLCRYGGEEFMVVLPRAGAAEVGQVAERVRALVANATLVEGTRGVRITLSIGGAALPDDAVDSEAALVRRASQALAVASRAGGDRVQLAQ